MQTFKAGQTYSTRSICDSECIVSIKVISRTAKTIKVERNGKPPKTLRISESYNGAEMVKPWGSYSMCPIITAGD